MSVAVEFLDVGQGSSCVVIDEENGQALLIDCPPAGDEVVHQRLDDAEAELDAAIVSHSDRDHLGGVYLVIRARQRLPGAVYYNHDRALPDRGAKQMRAALLSIAGLEDDGVRLDDARAPIAGVMGSVSWEIISPTKGKLTKGFTAKDANAASAIVRIDDTAARFRYLLPGDADGLRWRRVIDQELVKADALALPHHGGEMPATRTRAGIEEILAAVDAAHHIISVGTDNTYGHPAESTLAAINARATVARTWCTQVNAICQGPAALPTDQAAALGTPAAEGLSSRPGPTCACAGTIRFALARRRRRRSQLTTRSSTRSRIHAVVHMRHNPAWRADRRLHLELHVESQVMLDRSVSVDA